MNLVSWYQVEEVAAKEQGTGIMGYVQGQLDQDIHKSTKESEYVSGIHDNAEKFDPRTEEAFKYVQVRNTLQAACGGSVRYGHMSEAYRDQKATLVVVVLASTTYLEVSRRVGRSRDRVCANEVNPPTLPLPRPGVHRHLRLLLARRQRRGQRHGTLLRHLPRVHHRVRRREG